MNQFLNRISVRNKKGIAAKGRQQLTCLVRGIALLALCSTSFADSGEQMVEIHYAPTNPLCVNIKKELTPLYQQRGYLDEKLLNYDNAPKINEHFWFYQRFLKEYKFRRPDMSVVDAGTYYYLFDIDNDKNVELVETISGGGWGPVGDGAVLYIYKRNWLEDQQPISFYPEPDYLIGSMTNILEDKTTGDSYYAYFISPFFYQGKNYLLLQYNHTDMSHLFIVSEVLSDGTLITHCQIDFGTKHK